MSAKFDVRGEPDCLEAFLNSQNLPPLSAAFSITRSEQDKIDILRVGRRRILIHSAIDCESKLLDKFRNCEIDGSVHCALVSDMYSGMSISGTDAWQIIAQVSPINLGKFQDNSVKITEIFGQAGYIIRLHSDNYSIFVESSFRDYVSDRLLKCALR